MKQNRLESRSFYRGLLKFADTQCNEEANEKNMKYQFIQVLIKFMHNNAVSIDISKLNC